MFFRPFSSFISLCIMMFIALEYMAPRVNPPHHLVYRDHVDLPPTYWPDIHHRAVSDSYNTLFKANSRGFKDVDHELRKPPGVYRVLLLGDEYVEGLPVPAGLEMGRVLEEIAGQHQVKLEVISLAMSGWGQSHQLQAYRNLGVLYDPDVVITFFNPDDVHDNVGANAFHHLSEGALRENPPQILKPLSFAEELARQFLYPFEAFFVARNFALSLPSRGAPPSRPWLEQPFDQDGDEARLMEGLLRTLKGEVIQNGDRRFLAVMTSQRLDQSLPSQRAAFGKGLFRKLEVEVLDMHALLMDEYRLRRKVPYLSRQDPTWDHFGHSFTAKQIWRRMEELGWLKPSSLTKASGETRL